METTKVTDAELKEQGATIKVGLSQLNNATPNWISKLTNGIIFACLVWGLISMSITSLSPELKASINEWVLVASGVIKLGSKFFGYSLPEKGI